MKKRETRYRAMAFAMGCCAFFTAVHQVQAVNFTGADPNNNLFSTTGNWDTFPTANVVVGSFANTTASSPAQLDAAFNSLVANLGNFTIATPGAGTAYVEVLSGATNRTVNLYIGNILQPTRGGVLTLDAGSVLMPQTGNSGILRIGVNGAGELVAKDGMAGFGFANLELGANGTLVYEFGANSVSTFVSTKNNGAASMILDGVIELDLSAGPAIGSYSLIESSHVDTTMTGALATWLTGQGGSYTNTGSYAGANFKVLNGGTTEWVLSSANGGGTLNFTVIPEPATLGLFAVSIGMFMAIRKLRF